MSSGRYDDWSGDRVWVHARLRIVIQSNQRPVSDNSCNALISFEVLVDNQIFYRSCIHQNYIWHDQNLGQQGRREQSSVLHHDESTFIFVWDSDFSQEAICWLADNLDNDAINQPGRLLLQKDLP